MEKQMLIDTIQKAHKTQEAINDLENVNRKRMCEVIVAILKEKGGKVTADDWEDVLDENLEITFISQDGTYINDFCGIDSVEFYVDSIGTPTFKIDCEDSNDFPEYEMTYDNVCQIFEGLSEYWQYTQR